MDGSTDSAQGSMKMSAEEQTARECERYASVRQYSLARILAVWAPAAIPMAVLAWVVAPLLGVLLGGDDVTFIKVLLLCILAGLIWQFVLVMLLVHQERGSLRWSVLKDALWLHSPRSPRTGRVGGRLWLVLIPFVLLFAAEGAIPFLSVIPPVASHDANVFVQSDTGQAFMSGNWVWFAVIVALFVFNTVLGEELLFRGLLLPRMKGAFRRWDWVANGILFAVYHLHEPWLILSSLVDTFALSYPSRRYRSALIGIIVHSSQSVLFFALIRTLVLQ